MRKEQITDQKILEILSDDDSVLKTEAINTITFNTIDDRTVKSISELVTDENKAIRNAVTNFLIYNNSPIIPQLVINYAKSSNIAIRNLAGEILIKKGKQSLQTISSELKRNNNNDDIKFFVDILGLIGDKSIEDIVIEILSNNDNENVIVACIEALGNVYSNKAIDTIISFYGKTEVLKPVVIEAIGKIRNPKSQEFIVNNFDTEDDLLKFIMIESLGEIGDDSTFFFLLSKLGDLNGTLSWSLLEAIYKIKLRFDLDIPFDDKIKKCVLDTILNAEPRYQVIAAHMVKLFDDREILTACLNIYGFDVELDEILYEKFTLNKQFILSKIHSVITNDNKYLSAILKLLQNIIETDIEVLNKLSEIQKRKLTESLSDCLTNPDEIIRITAAEIIFNVDEESALLFLDTMASDENFWNRMRLLDLISNIDNTRVAETLSRLSEDIEEMVSDKAKEIAARKIFYLNN